MALTSYLTLSNILLALGFAYFAYTASSFYEIFKSPHCDPSKDGKKCLDSMLYADGVNLELRVAFSSSGSKADANLLVGGKGVTVVPVKTQDSMLVESEEPLTFNVSLPKSVRNNGSMYIVAGIVKTDEKNNEEKVITWDRETITTYIVPLPDTINLLGGEGKESKESDKDKSVKVKDGNEKNGNKTWTHWRKRLDILLSSDPSPLPPIDRLPPEFSGLVYSARHGGKNYYVPPVHIDRLVWRQKELIKVDKDSSVEMPIELRLRASDLGRLRFRFTIYQSMAQMRQLGFADNDLDDIRSLFADTSLWLLLITVFVSTLHLIFDFLAFKNDVSFWRNRKNTSGISTGGIAWRAVSTFIIALYLWDEKASLLVSIPMGLSFVIEIWKLAKALHIKGISMKGVDIKEATAGERKTNEYDRQAMKYLAVVMIPLLIGCAIYSLLYVPHRSWYSFVLQILVNAVYAFGFLFMLPQLFINYRLKSVAHLPWRVFIYRALNTFIDDLFAFIITMPTSHRLATLRDDVCFLIYLYQRWLYPVDPTRPVEMPDADGDTGVGGEAKPKSD